MNNAPKTIRARRWAWLANVIGLANLIGFIGVALLAGVVSAAESSPGLPPDHVALQQEFASHVQPFLKAHCFKCHDGQAAKGDFQIAKLAMDSQHGVFPDPKLVVKVLRAVQDKEMPPADNPQPSDDQRVRFVKAVHRLLEVSHEVDPGQVTVRRLNRVEYNHTIRDLLDIEGDFSKDFPADDVGHGFDNIGDVLSLSTMHLERYLSAAQAIMSQAMVVDPPAKPPVRRVAAQQLGPTGPFIPPHVFRLIATKPKIPQGPLFTPFFLNQNFEAIALHPEQEYRLRARVYVKSDDGQPVQIVLMAYGKDLKASGTLDPDSRVAGNGPGPLAILKTFNVAPGSEESAETLEAPIVGLPGVHGGAIGLVRKKTDEARIVEVFINWLEFEGPLDPRPPTQRKLLACSTEKPPREQTREILARFAARAYRRPPAPDEVERLAEFVESAQARGEKWEAGIQLAMQAVLASPKFLFRLELDDHPAAGQPRALDEYQLASRLSYFLWSTMPDDELFDLAERGQLTANLEPQVRRMLQDPKAQALVENFAMQWLQLRRLQTYVPDAKQFPNFDEKLRSAMLQETTMLFEAIMREDRDIVDLVDADFTFLNERLARHYGIIDTNGNLWNEEPQRPPALPIVGDKLQRIQLPPGQRGGIVTLGSVLTVTSSPTRTSPVKRGRWILEQLLGAPPPPPPPNVPELREEKTGVDTGSLRQRLEQHRSSAICASCHARMDPLGFALENYDAIGAFRDRDGTAEIDAAATLPSGEAFQGSAELKALLRGKKDQFSRCLIEKMLTYALGRGLESYDQATIERIVRDLAARDYKYSALVTLIVASDPFCKRRGEHAP